MENDQAIVVRGGLPVRFQPEALDQMRQDLSQLEAYVESVLEKDVDWGRIPGVPQPFLWEPGADKVLSVFNCYARPVVLKQEIDDVVHQITYIVMAEVVSRQTGEVVATGIGIASTREGKYGARWVENPRDYGYDPATLRRRTSKTTRRQEWRIPNPDWADLVHTLLQMAYKRAKVDAVQGLPGASSALRRLFQGRAPRPAQAPQQVAESEEEPLFDEPEPEDKPNYSAFWGEMHRAGILPDKVHEVLGVRSLKEDWVAKGRTLEQARQQVFRQLGITPPEKQRLL
jgi:hypothetical protein